MLGTACLVTIFVATMSEFDSDFVRLVQETNLGPRPPKRAEVAFVVYTYIQQNQDFMENIGLTIEPVEMIGNKLMILLEAPCVLVDGRKQQLYISVVINHSTIYNTNPDKFEIFKTITLDKSPIFDSTKFLLYITLCTGYPGKEIYNDDILGFEQGRPHVIKSMSDLDCMCCVIRSALLNTSEPIQFTTSD